VSYVPGDVSLWPQLTGAESLELFGNLAGGVDVAFRDELLERLDLDPSQRARPVSRVRWLGGHALLSLLGGAVLLAATGTALWLGVAASGSDEITWANAMPSVG
jgi:hypothetical protein